MRGPEKTKAAKRAGEECGFEGCSRPVEAAGMCAAHRGRKKKGKTIAGPIRGYSRNPFEGIATAALKYADAAAEGSNEDFQKAKWRFKTALRRYFKIARRTGLKPGGSRK